MRLVRPFLAAFCLVAGAFVGALNRAPVAIDLGVLELHTTVGLALIGSLLVGALAGGAAVALGRMRDVRRGFIGGRDVSRPEV